jgi:squalene synthase HpnD
MTAAPTSPQARVAEASTTEATAEQSGASGSSFYAGMRVLPKAEREAMYAIYGFCRVVDDIADDLQGDRATRTAELNAWRADLDSLYAGGPAGRAAFLVPAVKQFHPNKADFVAVIDGMQMDVDADIRTPDYATLDLYIDRVACAVGRLSVKVFGMEEQPGLDLAHHLGRALQLTNILRDFDEDAAIGRLYIPRETLDRAGIPGDDPHTVVNHANIDKAARELLALARQAYAEADRVLGKKPRGRLLAPRLMSAVYGKTLDRTAALGWNPPRTRVKVGKGELLWLVLRHGLFG